MLQESLSSHNIPHVSSSAQRQHRSSEMSSPTMHNTPQTAKKKISPDALHQHHMQPYPTPQQQFNSQQRSLMGGSGGGGGGSTTGSVGSKSSTSTRQTMEYGGSGSLFFIFLFEIKFK